MRINKGLVGVAGEYYVAAELSKRGYLASITLRNSEGIDILCSNQEGTKAVSIQVKTTSGTSPKWILNKKAEEKYSDNFYYVFVLLSEINSPPQYYIVPSIYLSDYVRTSHTDWLKGAKLDGNIRMDSDIRNFKDLEHKFKDRWDLLDI